MFDISIKNQILSFLLKSVKFEIDPTATTISGINKIGSISGAGEFEIGEATIIAMPTSGTNISYRLSIGHITVGIILGDDGMDDLGPIDILATNSEKAISYINPKIILPLSPLDYSTLKYEVKTSDKLRIKNESSLPATPEIYVLD